MWKTENRIFLYSQFSGWVSSRPELENQFFKKYENMEKEKKKAIEILKKGEGNELTN